MYKFRGETGIHLSNPPDFHIYLEFSDNSLSKVVCTRGVPVSVCTQFNVGKSKPESFDVIGSVAKNMALSAESYFPNWYAIILENISESDKRHLMSFDVWEFFGRDEASSNYELEFHNGILRRIVHRYSYTAL